MRFFSMLFFSFLIFHYNSGSAQVPQYLVKLKDKKGTPYSVNQPSAFLSQRSIERRIKQNIQITEEDLPVTPSYLDSIRSVGNVVVRNVSKWLNQVSIETSDPVALAKIANFTFVSGTQQIKRMGRSPFMLRDKFVTELKEVSSPGGTSGIGSLNYGLSQGQVTIHKGNFLHDKGFTGRGMLIAIIDDGFYHYKTLPAFDSIRLNGKILDMYDFVGMKTDMNEEDIHGTYCLSIMASNVPGQMIGTAPGASYLMYRSEDKLTESPAEEQNWIAAAERSDSSGADVISTSLGYNTFDNPAYDYTYQDMNGKTSMIAKAATIAVSKGMVLLVAAGNEGNKPWHYITTPADAFNILAVGAVSVSGVPGVFSSYGPSADGRVKPEVASVGVATFVQNAGGTFSSGNGTSFATPNLAGLVTCLWQAFPEFSSLEIMDVVKRSSDHYNQPNFVTGYGIPDFQIAYNLLMQRRAAKLNTVLNGKNLIIYPNPLVSATTILVKAKNDGDFQIALYDMAGRLCYQTTERQLQAGEIRAIPFSKNTLSKGMYILKSGNRKEQYSSKLIVQ